MAWHTNDEVECIDLTISPDLPIPQSRRPQQQPLSNYFKSKSRDTSSFEISGPESSGPEPETAPQPEAAPRAEVSIHPNQLRQIIATSNPVALQNVVLDLCAMSPALSRAIARGLASHSTYAKNIITAYHNKGKGPSVKAVPGAPQRKAFPPTPHPVKMEPNYHRKTFKEENRASIPVTPKLHSAINPSRNDIIELLTDSEDDEDLRLFPKNHHVPINGSRSAYTARPVRKVEEPGPIHLKHESPGSARASLMNRDSPTIGRGSQQTHPEPKSDGVLNCKNCKRLFEDVGHSACIYHPGRKITTETEDGRRMPVYSCCRRPIYSDGCQSGSHDFRGRVIDFDGPSAKRQRLV
jgi:hypothetical protein